MYASRRLHLSSRREVLAVVLDAGDMRQASIGEDGHLAIDRLVPGEDRLAASGHRLF